MATARNTSRPVIDPRSDTERSPDQVAREDALREVEETLLHIEQAIKRADRGRNAIRGDGNDNLKLSLDTAVEQLEAVRRRLFQDAYFGGEAQGRLI